MKKYVEKRNGGYYIAGKRVSLDSIVYSYWNGASPEGIQSSFPTLTLEEVYGAIAFYLANREDVDKSIEEGEIEFEKLRQASREKDPAFYEKMERARIEMVVEQ